MKVRRSLQAVRAFHAVGRKSLDRHPDAVGYGSMEAEAERLGVSAEMLRKARAFAGAYTDADLDDLYALADGHDFPLGVSHVIRLLSIPTRSRARFQRATVQGRWSKRRLDAEIRKRFGNRQPAAGRRQASPETAEDAYYAIARLCHQWQRLTAALDRPPAIDAEGVRVSGPELPPKLCKLLTQAADVMGELERAVSEKPGGENGGDGGSGRAGG